MKDQILSLYEYGAWVNQRVLEAAAKLTDEPFTQKVLPGFGSVHLTLAHMLGAEVIWLARWQGQSPTAMPAPDELNSVPILQARWAVLEAERRAYFEAVTEAELGASMNWTNMRGQPFALPRWQVVLHCVNHSTHHRSELAAMLTVLGHEPDSTDLLEFYLNRASQHWKPTGKA